MLSLPDHQQFVEILKPSFPRLNRFDLMESSGTEGNNGYTSNIIRLTVEYQKAEKSEVAHLVLKMLPDSNPAMVAFLEEYKLFNREHIMYTEILPKINELLKSSLTPTHYISINPNIIILENMSVKGFECYRSGQLIQLQHSYSILRALANFHAATHKLQVLNPRYLDDQLLQVSVLAAKGFDMILTFDSIIPKILQRRNAFHLLPKFKAAQAFFRNSQEVAAAKLQTCNFHFVVLNHGDFRKDNLLFKYDSRGELEEVKMVDFQTSFWTSPVYDFVFWVTTSLQVDVVEEHFDQLLDWYLLCLNEKLRELQVCSTYEKVDFMNDLKELAFFVVVCSIISICMAFPFDKAQVEKILSPNECDKSGLYSHYLENEGFVDMVLKKLQFCDKLGMYDAFQNDE